MALPTGYHVQMVVTDSEGNLVKMLPVSVASDVKLDPSGTKVAETVTNLQELVSALGSLAFKDKIDSASIDEAGLVKLSNSISDPTQETTAATTAAVSQVAEIAEGAVQNTGDEDVEGVKNFEDGISVASTSQITASTDEETGSKTITISFS